MQEIYFIRHGESEWNVADRICGRTDIPLTERGREQARVAGEDVLRRGIHADRILYSPLSRAAETAMIISQVTGIPAVEEPRLIEQHFGRWEGTSPRNAPAFQQAKQQFVTSYEGGESMLHLAHRIYSLLDELLAAPETCILVAHNGIARVIQSYFHDMTNDEFARFGVQNAAVTVFHRD